MDTPKATDNAGLVKKPHWAIWLTLPGVALLVVISGCIIGHYMNSWEHSGQFGDMFGMANALFSGLAFAGVVISLAYQRAEMEEARTDAKDSAKRHQQAAALQIRAIEAANFKTIYEVLNDDEVRHARGVVLEHIKQLEGPFPMDRLKASDIVVKKYELAGIMCKRGYANTEAVLEIWGQSILQCQRKVAEWMREKSIKEKDPLYWNNYMELAEAAAKKYHELAKRLNYPAVVSRITQEHGDPLPEIKL